MLSIHAIGAAGDAVDYYQNLTAIDDYYAGSGEPAGQWLGLGATELSLNGNVDSGAFRNVLEGQEPVTGDAIVAGAGAWHRPGWDCTFSAPKSVSVAWAVADPTERDLIQSAHDRAVRAAFAILEREAAVARRGHGGEQHERTNGLVACVYQHATSRSQEPHLHSHVIVANMAQRDDRTWGALEGRYLYQWKMAAGATYRAELAEELGQLGFMVEPDSRDSFRLAGVPQSLCRHWSSRSLAIIELAEERGLATAKALEVAALATRERKTAVDRAELFAKWNLEAEQFAFTGQEVVELRRPQIDKAASQELSLGEADAQILRSLTERQSAFRRADIFRASAVAAQYGGGGKTAVQKQVERLSVSAQVVRMHDAGGHPIYTTREMQELEAGILDAAVRRDEERLHYCADVAVEQACRERTLSDEQKEALRYLARDSGGVACIVGDAGTGKSYLMAAARDTWVASGLRVRGAALAGKAADGLYQGSGIASQTLHSLLSDLEARRVELTRRDVIVLDEAGMVGSRQLAELLQRVTRAGAKLVLVGDHKQLQPIEAGGAFRHIANVTRAARLADNRRQVTAADRKIVQDFALGNAREALNQLRGRGQFHTAETREQACAAMVKAWRSDLDRGSPEQCLMIAGSRADVRSLNRLARAEAHDAGELGEDHEVRLGDGERVLPLARGDRLLFTRNSRLYGVRNGQLGSLREIEMRDDGAAILTIERDGGDLIKVDTREYAHLDYGNAITAHKSQGVTVDRAHVFVSESMSDREWSYVAVSRARLSTSLYASNSAIRELGVSMSRSRQSESTLDFAQDFPAFELALRSLATVGLGGL